MFERLALVKLSSLSDCDIVQWCFNLCCLTVSLMFGVQLFMATGVAYTLSVHYVTISSITFIH